VSDGGRMFRITLASGEQYEVPEENAQKAMLLLDRKGVKFTDASPVAAAPPEAPAYKSGGGASGNWSDESPSLLDAMRNFSLSDTVRQAPWMGDVAARPAAQAAGAGFEHGISAGAAQNLPGGVGDLVQQDYQRQQQASPQMFGAGDVAGAVAMPVPGGAQAGVLRPMAQQAAMGGGQAAMRSYSDSQGDPGDRALAALAQGGEAGLKAGALTGAVGAAGKLAGGAAGWFGDAADKARTAAIGATGADLKKLAKSRGLDFVEGPVGSMPEELGVTNTLLPVSPSGYAQRFAAKKDAADQAITQSIADAQQQGVGKDFVDQQALVDAVRRQGAQVGGGLLGDRDARAAAYDKVGNALADQSVQTPADLRSVKTAYDHVAYPKQLEGSSESFMGQAHKTAADAARGQLRDAMSYALPETEQAFTQGNQQYGQAAILEELARNRAAQQYAGGGLMGNLGAAAIGAGIGSTFGGASGAMGGAALGFARPAMSAAQQYGPDLGANMARLGERGMGAMGGGMQSLAQSAPTGGAFASQQGGIQGDPLQHMGAQLVQAQDEARGHLMPQVIQQVLQTNPQLLGSYAQEFAQTPQQDDDAINATLERLTRTDQRFRTTVLPQLQQFTAEPR
jgi:hypothetical protein